MSIIKELNLNDTLSNIKSKSIVGAKNIKIDNTASYIMNDNGFTPAFLANSKIVGVIPCNEEFIVFCYKDDKSEVYRVTKTDITKINVDWTYSGGNLYKTKVHGAYTYNYKKELIVIVGEYPIEETFEDDFNIPLKSWNIDTQTNVSDQNLLISPFVPANENEIYLINKGSLVCGVYSLFIRYTNDNINYTNWFPIGEELEVIKLNRTDSYFHTFQKSAGSSDINQVKAKGLLYNENAQSNKAIVIKLDIENKYFKYFQIGYILKHDENVVGRIHNTYKISDKKETYTIDDNHYKEEISVTELLKPVQQYFNVRNINVYNNRVYISNYKEHEIEDFTDLVSDIDVYCWKTNVRDLDSLADDATINHENNSGGTTKPENKQSIKFDIGFEMQYMKNDDNKFPPIPRFRKKYTAYYDRIDGVDYILSKEESYNVLSKIWSDAKQAITYPATWDYLVVVNNANDGTYPGTEVKEFIIENNVINKNIILAISNTYIKVYLPESKIWTILYPIKEHLDTISDKTQLRECFIVNRSLLYANDFGAGKHWYIKTPYQYNNLKIHPLSAHIFGYGVVLNAAGAKGNYFDLDDEVVKKEKKEPKILLPDYYSIHKDTYLKTLIPNQIYSFYIHFVRRDGSYTNGYKIPNRAPIDSDNQFIPVTNSNGDKLFKVPNVDKTIFSPIFIRVPKINGYIGHFLSYEKVEQNTCTLIYLGHKAGDINTMYFTSTEVIFDLDYIQSTKLQKIGENKFIDLKSIKVINNNGVKVIEIVSDTAIDDNTSQYQLILDKPDIYTSKIKTLYAMSDTLYNINVVPKHLPHYYTRHKFYSFTPKHLIMSAASNLVFEDNNVDNSIKSIEDYTITRHIDFGYSYYNLNAMHLVQPFEKGNIHLVDNNNKSLGIFLNALVSPTKLHQLFGLKGNYRNIKVKTYTNYISDIHIDKFNHTIRRSNVMSEESLVNAFRLYEPTNYRNIFENKGDIVKICGYGLIFLIHCKYSLYIFDRSPQLTAKSQTQIPDTFDVDYQEITTSENGYGGLDKKEESIMTKWGYLWFDKSNNTIYKYDGKAIQLISNSIDNFLKNKEVDSIRWAEDILNNRCFVCIKFKGIEQPITLSYNFLTNSFISAHDFSFNDSHSLYDRSLFFNNKADNILYTQDNHNINYAGLANSDTIFENVEIKALTEKPAYVDILFNYIDDVVVLNSIKYLTDIINTEDKTYNLKPIVKGINKYSGDYIEIYTNETHSGILDISLKNKIINELNKYKLPYFEKGVWNLNYFRNNIIKEVTKAELDEEATKYNINVDKIIKANQGLTASDHRSLIYGKWIVVRFIFNRDNRFKLEDVNINVEKY